MRAKLLVLLGATLLGVVGGLVFTFLPGIGRGSFNQFFICVLLAVFVCVPAGGIAVVAFLVSLKWRPRVLGWVGTISVAVVVVAVLIGLSYVPGYALATYDVGSAWQYCDMLVPLLDEHKERSGSYPDSIAVVLPEESSLPFLLRNRRFYKHFKDKDSFTMSFKEPRAFFFSWHIFESESREWYVDD